MSDVRRVTWVGLAVNVFLSLLKLVFGVLGASQAVVADAVHSLSDGLSDVAILIGVRYWSAPPDADHPHGHRRIETLVTVLIGALLAATAVGLIANALLGLHAPPHRSPGWIAFWAAITSVLAKEGLYHWTVAVGRRAKSPAVVANAWHHRSDALSSLPAALAVAGAAWSPDWGFLDHVGAVAVSFFILQASWRVVRPSFAELVDRGAPEPERRRIEELAGQVEGVVAVHAIRTRYIGAGMEVDLHITVDGSLTVRHGHDVSESVKRKLLEEGPDVVDVVAHLEPDGDGVEPRERATTDPG